MKRCFEYINDINTGKISSCLYVKLAVKRFEKDLENPSFIFKEEKAQRVINFIEKLKHSTGKFSDLPFILSPWQVFIIANLYGFYYKDSGLRRFTSSYIEMSRKQGKTAFVAALSLYALSADGEDGAEVLLVSNSKEQARIAFTMASTFVKKIDSKSQFFKPYRYDIKFPLNTSVLKVLSADATKLDGYNCSFGIVDEYHSAPDSSVKDVIASSMGMRENPMLNVITTAGFNKTYPCYLLRQSNIDILHGLKVDDSAFCIIYTLDDGDDWQDEKNWIKSSPNLDVTVTTKFLKEQVQKAKNNPSEEVGILTKNFNIWCDAANVWIPSNVISRNSQKLNFEDFKGLPCYIGVDLASIQDLTAVSYSFLKDSQIFTFIKFYIPEESLNTRTDKEVYKQWKRESYLNVTAGNVTDYNYITKDILEVQKLCKIKKIAYDNWNSTQWATEATVLRLPLEPFSQTVGNFNGATRELERLLLTDKITLDYNPILKWNFDNVTIRMDANGNIKPDKAKSSNKIDGVIALIQSIAVLIEDNRKIKNKITL